MVKHARKRREPTRLAKPPLSLVVEQDPTTVREKTNKLREAITGGFFEPGEQRVERDVCARTDVSRTSLREALRHLETEGVVESRKSEGVFVCSLTADHLRDVYELRMALDAEAARHFAQRASEANREALRDYAAELACVRFDDVDQVIALLNGFFEILHEGGGNRLGLTIMRALQTRISLLRAITQRSRYEKRFSVSAAMIRTIADEVLERRPQKAAKLCRDFAARSLDFALSTLVEDRV